MDHVAAFYFGSMCNFVSSLSLVVFLSGCAGCAAREDVRDVRPIPAGTAAVIAPAIVADGLRREHDVAFSPQEQRIIAAARQYLEQQDHQPIDAYYRVTHTSEYYEVYVRFVSGYRGNEPDFVPGQFCTVLLREDGSVIRVLPGA